MKVELMTINISELYDKKVISTSGKVLGEVKDVILNMDDGTVAKLLFSNISSLMRSSNVRKDLFKNSVDFKRVRKVSQTIIVGEE